MKIDKNKHHNNFWYILGHATDEMFVKYVEDNRILWDTRCSDYKDCKEKALVWDSVGANCGITGMIKLIC